MNELLINPNQMMLTRQQADSIAAYMVSKRSSFPVYQSGQTVRWSLLSSLDVNALTADSTTAFTRTNGFKYFDDREKMSWKTKFSKAWKE